jgi:exonuclease SbcC
MIPVKLTPKNFLSYGEDVPALDFTQFHVACLSGANGQGKSALLDALTWSIWGEGRKGSQERKADSSLLRMGQENMQVEFVFDLEEERYRIIRTFAQSGKTSKAGLEFQIYDKSKNEYVSLACPSTKETQDKITKTLRLDFQTFINSAFIMQGRGNEFSKKTARERKEVLSEILGLSHYNDLAELAKSYLREINNIITAKDSRLEYIAQELTQIDYYENRIKELTDDHSRITKEIAEKEAQVAELRDKVNSLKHKGERANELARAIEQQRREVYQKEKEIEAKKEEIADCEEVISQKEAILTRFSDYQGIDKENTDLTSKLREARRVEEEKNLLEKKIESEKSDLIVDLRNKEDRYGDLKFKAEQGEKSKAELSTIDKKIEEIKSLEKEAEEIHEKGNTINLELANIKNQINGIEKDIENNKEKIRLLEEDGEGVCPLCETKLDTDKKIKIKVNLNGEICNNFALIDKLKEEEGAKNTERNSLVNKWKEIKQSVGDKDTWQQRLSRIQIECKESEEATNQLADLQAEISGVKKILGEESFALEDYKKLRELKEQIKTIGYDEARHFQVTNEIEKLHDAPINKMKLEEAEKKFDSLKETLGRWQKDYQQKRSDIETQEKKIIEIKVELEGLSLLQGELAQEEGSLKQQLTQKEEILSEKGGYQSKYDQCLKLKEEKNKMEKELAGTYKEKNIYEKLIVAFGKNGIQALIIENALPEIEEEANNLLAKLTNNSTQIAMESLKDLKSGKLKETLDIKISDEMGVRDYELYSGGEAFRIDFSIRIALSKLLARRAGTKLRTLIIDEGFGTQDEEGLENMVEAIRSISDDFDKILVITHLDTLKNAFPVKIEVTKYPEIGSKYKIVKN